MVTVGWLCIPFFVHSPLAVVGHETTRLGGSGLVASWASSGWICSGSQAVSSFCIEREDADVYIDATLPKKTRIAQPMNGGSLAVDGTMLREEGKLRK